MSDHHSIIHDAAPEFDGKRMMYLYPNGVEQKIVINLYLFNCQRVGQKKEKAVQNGEREQLQ